MGREGGGEVWVLRRSGEGRERRGVGIEEEWGGKGRRGVGIEEEYTHTY